MEMDAMKVELTTLMHTEFFNDQEEILDILVMTAYTRIKRGENKDDVLKYLNLASDVYENRFDSIIGKYLRVNQ